MKTAILTFEQFHGKKGIGSSRIRGHWIVRNWNKAGADLGPCELFKHGGKYDCVIYQKAYFVDHAKAFTGLKIFDICDPDWMHWSYRFKEMLEAVDAITCSTLEIAKFIAGMTDKPIAVIPDRIDLSMLPERREHHWPVKDVLWYGYAHNFPMLESCIPAVKRFRLSLTVLSNEVFLMKEPAEVNLTNLPWSDSYLKDIQKGDVVINPQMKKGLWKFKSDNKTTLAWALGIPVAQTEEELKQIFDMSPAEREAESRRLREKAFKEFDVKLSVVELKELIVELQHGLQTKNTGAA